MGAIEWYDLNSGSQTHTVGGKSANGFGMYDMLGNVSEWVNDYSGEYPSSAQTNPTGPVSASNRVHRGGSWRLDAGFARSSGRGALPSVLRRDSVGFRVARTP